MTTQVAAELPPTKAIMMRIGAAICYVLMSALLKLAGDHAALSAPELVFYRAASGLPVIVAFAAAGPGLRVLRPNRLRPHLARGILGTISIIITFQALLLLPLATAITIGFTAPIFATLLSAIILREFVGTRRWVAVLAGFAGIIVVAQPSAAGATGLGVGLALLAALGQGSVTVTIRHLGKTETANAIVFWLFVISVALTAPFLIVAGTPMNLESALLVCGGGVLGAVMQLLLTASLRAASVSVLAPFDYFQIVAATILSWLAWGEEPGIALWLGGTLIAGSGIYMAWRERGAGPPLIKS